MKNGTVSVRRDCGILALQEQPERSGTTAERQSRQGAVAAESADADH